MNRKLFASLFAVSIMAASPAMAGQSIPSKISKVILFSNQALVQRTTSAGVEKGLTTLEMAISPLALDPDSVSARVKGKGEIISVQYRSVPLAASPRPKIDELEKKLRSLERSKQKLSDRRQSLDRQAAFLSAFVDFSQAQVPKEIQTRLPSAEELNRTLIFLDTGYTQIHTKRQEIDHEAEDLDREIQVVKRELAAMGRQQIKTRQFIEIVFHADQAQTLHIEAEYLVRNATWKPVYRVSVPASMDSAQLTTFAQVEQKTGEDWEKVNLTVSTAVPLRGTRLPEPTPWILDVPRIRERAMKKMDRMVATSAPMANQALVMEDMEAAEEVREATFARAQSRRTALSFSYELPQPLVMESRDKESTLPLMTKTLTGDFSHFCVPAQQALTFLILEAQADKELLAGPLNVHFAGQYVGKTYLEEKQVGERFKLSLGADRDIRVKREKIKDQVRETRFGSFERNRTVRELAYRITAENRKEVPATLTIVDSVPVSRTDRIEVKDMSISPKPTREKVSGHEGVLGWQMTLAPGQSQTIDIDFVVTYPKETPPPNLK